MKTETEILKAIKCCVNSDPKGCDDCPYSGLTSCLEFLQADYAHFLHRRSTDIHIPKAHVDQVYDIYAPKGQIFTVVEEECAELIQAITKHKRSESALWQDECRDGIVEELTHVAIMLRVLMKHLAIDQEEIDAEILRKAYKDHFDTSDYGIDPNEVFPNRKLGEEAARCLFPQCFEDCEVRTASSAKSFPDCPKWPSAEELNEILEYGKRDGT